MGGHPGMTAIFRAAAQRAREERERREETMTDEYGREPITEEQAERNRENIEREGRTLIG